MIQRCEYKKNANYYLYGGRGISVCKRWRGAFALFKKDMGDKPTPKHQLDRKNNNGNYCLSNCRWVTRKENQRNTRNTRPVVKIDKATRKELKKYSSIIETKEDGFTPSAVCSCCRGVQKTSGGFIWSYK